MADFVNGLQWNGIALYLEDIIIGGKNFNEHYGLLTEVWNDYVGWLDFQVKQGFLVSRKLLSTSCSSYTARKATTYVRPLLT